MNIDKIIARRFIKQLEDFKNWNIGSCTIRYNTTGDQYWIGNGGLNLQGYGDVYFKVNIFQRLKAWRCVKKMIKENIIYNSMG